VSTSTTIDTKNIILYESDDGKIQFDVNLNNDTVWLTQKQMAELFDKTQPTIAEHIIHIYEEKELQKKATHRNFRLVQKEGNRHVERDVDHYSLDVIISAGYRVKSKRGTQFRIWANSILKQHLIEGYTTNSKRLLETHREIEVKETKETITKLLGIDIQKNDSSNNESVIELVSNYMGALTDKEAIILKAHLLTERFLISYVEKISKNIRPLEDERLNYKQWLAMVRSNHSPQDNMWLWELLEKLNRLRNSFAHQLDTHASEGKIQEFMTILKKRMKTQGYIVSDDAISLKQSLVHLCGISFQTLKLEKS